MIRFQTLGRIALLDDGAPTGQRLLAQPRRLALLAYLLVRSSDGEPSRDELVGIFWGDRSEREAKKCLSQALHFIRHALGSEIITASRAHVTVDRTVITCDAAEVVELAATSSFSSAADAYAGQFLPGFTVGIPEVDQWIDGERAGLERIALRACIRAAEDKVLEEDRIGAAKFALRAADINPLDEHTALRVIRLLEEIECEKEAVGVFQKHAAALKSEIDEVPSSEATAIADGIRNRIDLATPCAPVCFPGLNAKASQRAPKQRLYEQIAVGIMSMAIFALLVSSYGWRRENVTPSSAVPTMLLVDERKDARIPAPAGYNEILAYIISDLSKAHGFTLQLATPELTDDVSPPSGPVVVVRLDHADAGSDSIGLRALMLDPLTGGVLSTRRVAWLAADPTHRQEIAVRLATSLRNDLGAAVARYQADTPRMEPFFSTVIKERALADSLRLSGAHTAARSLLEAVEAQLTSMKLSPHLLGQRAVQRAAVAFDLMWLELSSPQRDQQAARAALARGLEAMDELPASHSGQLELMTARANLLFWSWQTAPPESLTTTTARADARRLLESVVDAAPGRAEAWAQLSAIYEAEEQYTSAYRAARFAIAMDVYAQHRMELASRLYNIALEMADTSSARQWCTHFSRGNWQRTQCELTTAVHRGQIPTSELVRLRGLLNNVPADSWSAPRLSLLLAAVLGVSGRESEARLLIAEHGGVGIADPEIDLFRAMAALPVGNTAAAKRYLDMYMSGDPIRRSHVARSQMFAHLYGTSELAAAVEPQR